MLFFLAAASCAVAQIPLRFLPPDITGRDSVGATTGTFTYLYVDGTPITTGSGGYWVTTATAQTITGQKTFTSTQVMHAVTGIPGYDLFIDGPVSIRDSAGTTQIRIGSIPEFLNGFDLKGDVTLPSGGVVTIGGSTSALKELFTRKLSPHVADGFIECNASFYPPTAGNWYLGNTARRWYQVAANQLNSIFLDAASGTGLSIRDSALTTQIYIGSRPIFPNGFDVTGGAVVPFPNGLTSQGETVITSLHSNDTSNPHVVTASQLDAVTTTGAQDITGQKTISNAWIWNFDQTFGTHVKMSQLRYNTGAVIANLSATQIQMQANTAVTFAGGASSYDIMHQRAVVNTIYENYFNDVTTGWFASSGAPLRLVYKAGGTVVIELGDASNRLVINEGAIFGNNKKIEMSATSSLYLLELSSSRGLYWDNTATEFQIRNQTGPAVSVGAAWTTIAKPSGDLSGTLNLGRFNATAQSGMRVYGGTSDNKPGWIGLGDDQNLSNFLYLWRRTGEGTLRVSTAYPTDDDTEGWGIAFFDKSQAWTQPQTMSFIDAPAGTGLSIRDSAGTTQIRIGSIPNCPNGLLSQGETVLTSATLASVGGGVTTDTAQNITGAKTFQVTQYFRNIYGEASQDIKMQAAVGQALRLSFGDGTTALYIPSTVQPVQFPRGILSNANLAAGTKVQFGGGDASKALAILAGNPVAGQVDNLMEVQASGKSLPANFNGNLFTIYKAATTYNGYSWPKALARVWDNDAYDANCTGALLKLAWTNPHANGRALLDFTVPNTQTGAAYFWKVGTDYGSTRTFEADCDGNVDSDGVADFDDYTSDVGGPSDHSQGIYSQHTVTIQPPSGVPCISAGAYGGIYTALLNNTGTGAVLQGSNTGGGHFIFGSTQGGTGSVLRGTQNGGGYCISVDVSGTATGGCAQLWQGGTLSANNNYYAARILRGSDISTYSYLWPMFQLLEQHSGSQTDGNSTFQMYWGNGFHGAGKIMIDAVPDPGVNGLNGQDFLFKYSGRSDYYLDFAGNLRLPGIITSDYSFDSKDNGADTTAPASGYGRRYVKNDQPWWMNDSGGASQITTTFGAWSQYGSVDAEASYTGSTAYQQRLRVTTPSLPAGNYRISWYCELSADASNERLSSRVQIDDTTTIHECSCYVSETYANGGWTNRAGHYVGALGAGVHNLDLDYAIEDTGDTVYIRRARIMIWRMP